MGLPRTAWAINETHGLHGVDERIGRGDGGTADGLRAIQYITDDDYIISSLRTSNCDWVKVLTSVVHPVCPDNASPPASSPSH